VTTQPTFGQVVVLGIAVATVPLAAVALLVGGPVAAGAVVAFGWLLAVPLVALLASSMGLLRRDDGDGPGMAGAGDDEVDPLEALKERYARGEIDEEEFERRLSTLVELDDVEMPDDLSVADRSGPERADETDDDAADREPAFER